MLEKFRRGASKIFATLLFCILIASFALWGIPNYNKDYSQNTLAQVGDVKLTEDDYRRFFDNQLNIFSQQAGQRLTRENARMFYRMQQMQQGVRDADLDREVLNLQINQTLLDQEARKMGLGLPEASIVEAIRTDPQYLGDDKKFNRALFEERARQAGFTANGYIRERRAGEVRDQLMETLTTGLPPSKTLIEIAHKFTEEERVVSTVVLDPAKLPKIADPDDTKIAEYYKENQRQYMAPEMRKLAILMLSRDDIKAKAAITDAEVKAAWEKDPAAWNIWERRRFQQIAFKDKAAAEGVAKEIAGGKSFLMAGLEEGKSNLDQFVPRSAIADAKIAKAIFEAELNKVLPPIETRGAVILARVTEIQPGRVRPFEEVAKDIRADLEQKKQRELTTRLHDQIEDLRGAGKPLKQVAEELKLPLREVAETTSAGIGPDGKPAFEHPDARRILGVAFEGGKEVPREAVDLAEGGQAWVEVAAVTPSRQKPIEEVKSDVKAGWFVAEARKALTAASDALVNRVKAGETLAAVAKSQGLKLETQKPFKRQGPFTGLPPAAGRQAFTLPKGGIGSAETQDGKSRVIFTVTDIKQPAAPGKEDTDRLTRALQLQFQNDARTIYVSALRNRAGVKIDEVAYKRLTGGDQQQQ